MRTLAGCLLVVLTATVVVRSADPDLFHHDVGWILYTAGEMLDGSALYADILDENPPLVFWLSVPVVGVARGLGLDPLLLFNLAVWLAIVGCTGLGVFAWRDPLREDASEVAWALFSLLLVAWVWLPRADYGQREHLLVVLLTPYVFTAARELSGRPLAPAVGIMVGVIAGVGVALKPYFAAIPLCIELMLIVRRRDLVSLQRGEPWALALVQIGYVACALWFTPGYFDYLVFAWPVYNAYNVPIVWFRSETVVALVAALGVAFLRPTPLDRDLRSAWLAAGLGALVLGYAQRKGWPYHFLPVLSCAVALVASVLVARARGARRALLPALVILSAGGLWIQYDQAHGRASQEPSLNRVLTSLVRERAAGQSILALASTLNPAFPVVNLSGAHWAHRFCCMWALPAVYSAEEKATMPFPYHDLAQMGPIERYAFEALIEDFATQRPALLIVDDGVSKFAFGRTGFRYLEYFLRDPRFARAFRDYRYVTTIEVFQIYERVAPDRRAAEEAGE